MQFHLSVTKLYYYFVKILFTFNIDVILIYLTYVANSVSRLIVSQDQYDNGSHNDLI